MDPEMQNDPEREPDPQLDEQPAEEVDPDAGPAYDDKQAELDDERDQAEG